MTWKEKITQLRKQLDGLKSSEALQIAAQDTHVKMTDRIFIQGQSADGGNIGNYDTKNELYINPNNSPKSFPTKGKPNDKGIARSKFKDGTPHKTGYFKSYRDYRETIGREASFVNLVLSGDMQSDFGKAVTKVSNLKYASTLRSDNNKKKQGAEDKYGEIFNLTDSERLNFVEVLRFETNRMLKSA